MLIPVVPFLRKHNISSLIEKTLTHERGNSALYDAADGICSPLSLLWGGCQGQTGIVTVWSDRVLRLIAGWSSIPDDSSFGHLFKSFTMRHVSEMETLDHTLPTRIWRSAMRHVRDLIGARCYLIPLISRYTTKYQTQT
jgi:hypothetical protein